MAIALLDALIDKVDSVEIVRDQIAGILVAELANQQSLAPGEGEDPLDFTLDVKIERDMPIEKWLDPETPVDTVDTVPIVSVWWESSSIDAGSSTVAGGKQVFDVIYNLDVFARGVNRDEAVGYTPHDTDARLRCHAAVRLVRNILSALPNRRLQLKTIVQAYPLFENMELGSAINDETESAFSVWNCRMRLKVPMIELSPELAASNLIELIRIDVSDDGGVVLSTEIS